MTTDMTIRTLPLFLTLLALPLTAQDAPEPAPAPTYDSDDLMLEGSLAELKDKGVAGDAAASRQVYMRYAVQGKMAQAKAWADRYIAQLEKLAEGGDVQAMLVLGTNYITGKDFVALDTAKAVTWLSRAAEAGNPSAAYILAELYRQQGDAEMSRQSYERAYDLYSKLAEREPDNAKTLYWLGYMQQNGEGTTAAPAAGIARLEKAAEMGSDWACTQLFKTYTQGIGTAKDMARAIRYARQLADSGKDGLMAFATALAYLKGDGVEKDEALGTHYLDLAANANIAEAICMKATRLKAAGKAEEAYALYAQGASMQHEQSLIEAALMLLYGDGIEKDESRGLAYLQTANNRLNSPRAPYELARYYESIGEDATADDWYVSASNAGLIEAMAKRGLMHLNPFSPAEWSPTAAYQWWKKGSDEGDPDCIFYRRLFLYGLVPLVLIIVFGLPLYTVNRLNKKAEKEEKKG